MKEFIESHYINTSFSCLQQAHTPVQLGQFSASQVQVPAGTGRIIRPTSCYTTELCRGKFSYLFIV